MKVTCPRCKTDYDIQDPTEPITVECEECHLEFSVELPKIELPKVSVDNPDQRPLPAKSVQAKKPILKSSEVQKVEVTHLVNVTVKDLDISMGQMIWLTIKAIPAIFIGVVLFWLAVAVIGGVFGMSFL